MSDEHFVSMSNEIKESGIFVKMDFGKPIVSFNQALHNWQILPLLLTLISHGFLRLM